MQSLLGKIVKITPLNTGVSASGQIRLQIEFKPSCVLPGRTTVPEWLADQTLTVERTVADTREIGRPGDSLVLTATEAVPWLTPLVIHPTVSRGSVPPALRLTLRWWKDEKTPEYILHANGQQQSGLFAKATDESADWTATVETAPFYETPPTLPVKFSAVCGPLTTESVVLPEAGPCHYQTTSLAGAMYHLENDWYSVGITRAYAGGIRSLREKSRDVDHFQCPNALIQPPLKFAGHVDRLWRGWNGDSLNDAVAASGGVRREAGATRLTLEALVDEGQSLRTTGGYWLYDDLPLLLIQRDFFVGKAKEDDDKHKKPKEPINDLQSLAVGFRTAWQVERDGVAGSRILCAEDGDLVSLRAAQEEVHRYEHWRMTGGWGMVEHPKRHEYMLYLFDSQMPPHLASSSSRHSLTLQPSWPNVPVRPGEGVGFALALTAGEQAGASAVGAWVACRTVRSHGGVCCALVGRFPREYSEATFTLGAASETVLVQHLLLPGVGSVSCAVIEMPNGSLSEPFAATVAGLARRIL